MILISLVRVFLENGYEIRIWVYVVYLGGEGKLLVGE